MNLLIIVLGSIFNARSAARLGLKGSKWGWKTCGLMLLFGVLGGFLGMSILSFRNPEIMKGAARLAGDFSATIAYWKTIDITMAELLSMVSCFGGYLLVRYQLQKKTPQQ